MAAIMPMTPLEKKADSSQLWHHGECEIIPVGAFVAGLQPLTPTIQTSFRRATFREKFEWLEEAETLSLRLRKSRSALAREHAGGPVGQWSLARHALTPKSFP